MMRSEAEVRKALAHLEEAAGTDMAKALPSPTAAMLASLADVLHWVLDEPSEFNYTVQACDRIDQARRQ